MTAVQYEDRTGPKREHLWKEELEAGAGDDGEVARISKRAIICCS